MTKDNNIHVDSDKVINWIDFASTNPVDVDQLIEPLTDFFKKLEISCMAECCGINAFSFYPNDIRNACEEFSPDDLLEKINLLIQEITKLDGQVIECGQLNQLLHANVFLQILDHIKKNIKST